MDVYESLYQSWLTLWKSFGKSQKDRLNVLLSVEDEIQIRMNLELLLGFGDYGLCFLLDYKDGQVVLKEDYSHPLFWCRLVLDVVVSNDSWSLLYAEGGFDDMERMLFGGSAYNSLSESQRSKVVFYSKQMVDIPAGSFMMGALNRDKEAVDDEKPRHEVILTRGMLVSKYPCTQGLYECVMDENPSCFEGSTRPVERVSWCEAVLFCNRLSEREGLEPCYVLPEPFKNNHSWSMKVKWNLRANGYRLPTEAEWEYCARGRESHLYSGGDDIYEVAWFDENSGDETHPVGLKKSNGVGLHDMCGNVWEWVWDYAVCDRENNLFMNSSLYTKDVKTDPRGDPYLVSPTRIRRGGGWGDLPKDCRASSRFCSKAPIQINGFGFRFLRNLS